MPKVVVEFDAETSGAIREIDRMKKSVGGVGDNIATDLDTNLTKSEGKIKGFGSKIKSHGMAIGAGFLGGLIAGGVEQIGSVIVDQLEKSITAASDLNETLSKTNAVFGPKAPGVTLWGKSAAKTMGMSQRAALDAAADFATLGKAGGLTGDELVKFSEGLTGTAADLASFKNTSPEEAMTALAAGLRGESEPLRKYGILLDDAALRQEAVAMGITKTTKEALTPQQKVLASHAVIMKQLGDAAGDFSRTQDGVANQQRVLAAATEDAQAALGQKLLPAFLWLLQVSIKVVDFIMNNIIPAFGATIDQVGMVAEAIVTAWNWIWGISETVWNAVSGAVKTAANAIVAAGDWIQAQWNNIGTNIANAAKAMADGVVAAWNWLTGMVSSIWGNISGAVKTGVDNIKGWISGFAGWVGNAWSGVTSALSSPFEKAADIIRGIVDKIKGVWNSVASTISGVHFSVGPIPDWVPGIGGKTWDFNGPHIPQLAAGGYITSPTLALVGERGPEIVAPERMLRTLLAQSGPQNYVNVTVQIDGKEISSRARIETGRVLGQQTRRMATGVRY